ncbi:hypothetical protein STEG23_024512, partial [Scotinomys teguina]
MSQDGRGSCESGDLAAALFLKDLSSELQILANYLLYRPLEVLTGLQLFCMLEATMASSAWRPLGLLLEIGWGEGRSFDGRVSEDEVDRDQHLDPAVPAA